MSRLSARLAVKAAAARAQFARVAVWSGPAVFTTSFGAETMVAST